jgi:hypothetical protein
MDAAFHPRRVHGGIKAAEPVDRASGDPVSSILGRHVNRQGLDVAPLCPHQVRGSDEPVLGVVSEHDPGRSGTGSKHASSQPDSGSAAGHGEDLPLQRHFRPLAVRSRESEGNDHLITARITTEQAA